MPIHAQSSFLYSRVSYRFLFSRCIYCILARVQLWKLRDEGLFCLFVSGSRPFPLWKIATCKVSHRHSALKLLYAVHEFIWIRIYSGKTVSLFLWFFNVVELMSTSWQQSFMTISPIFSIAYTIIYYNYFCSIWKSNSHFLSIIFLFVL